MNTKQSRRLSDVTSCSHFVTDRGCEELFLTVRSSPGASYAKDLWEIEAEYNAAIAHLRLSDETVAFSKLFVSDYVNQQAVINQSPLIKHLQKGALSIIEQKSVGSGPFSLFSYHIRNSNGDPLEKKCSGDGSDCCVKGENYSMLLTANAADDSVFDAYTQTETLFKSLNETIEQHGMTLLGNTIRTWIYVHDVDNHYKNMVKARREYFAAHGLTDKTRYLASTGIEGCGKSPKHLVTVDSLSIGGLVPDQIIRIEALTNLSPTIVYGVTFERGLRVRFGDRSHLYISGTASINNKGEVLHTGDVEAQTQRTFDNVRALLREHGAGIGDMVYCLVYVRNFHEWELVRHVIQNELGDNVPLVAVEAKVCRPAWLFELEGMAILPDENGFPPFK